MTAIPLLSGMRSTQRADFQQQFPVNLEPVSLETGIAKGYIRSAVGATNLATGPGPDRGGIVWNNVLYRVMGTKLVSVSSAGTITQIGDVGGSDPVSLTFGFDRLAIRSGTKLWYYDGTTLVQVTDPDLGLCIDVAWLNGQYFSTDGTYVIATDISNPTNVNPLKYGAAESDPDMVTGLLPLRGEMYVFGQSTIEVQNYVGGANFPLQSNPGATIPIGCVAPKAKTLFAETFAFVGSARNDALGVWVASGGSATKISTRAIDDYLAAEVDPTSIVLERRVYRDEQRLVLHLSNLSLVFLKTATEKVGEPVWYELRSGEGLEKPYRLRNAVYCYNKWIVGDTESNALGVLDEAVSTHFGEMVGWSFQTTFLYAKANAFIVHALELVGLPGRGQAGASSVFMSYSIDGQLWSMERAISLGGRNERTNKIQFRPHCRSSTYMAIRFRGDSSSLAGFSSLEATVEGLNA